VRIVGLNNLDGQGSPKSRLPVVDRYAVISAVRQRFAGFGGRSIDILANFFKNGKESSLTLTKKGLSDEENYFLDRCDGVACDGCFVCSGLYVSEGFKATLQPERKQSCR
jgi:hypothetical protein